jgi:hypothetical protein
MGNAKTRKKDLLLVFAIIITASCVCLNLIGCDDKVSHEFVGFVEGTVIDSLTR